MSTLHFGRAPPCQTTLERHASAFGSCRTANHGFAHADARTVQALCQAEGLRMIELSTELGRGRKRLRRAREQLLGWQMHRGSRTTGIFTEGHGALVTYARMAPGLWVINPCRVIETRVDVRRGSHATTVGYTTTVGHLIAGRELLTVRRVRDGTVLFEVHSVSRGAGPIGRAIFPLLAPAQWRFFREQMRCMACEF